MTKNSPANRWKFAVGIARDRTVTVSAPDFVVARLRALRELARRDGILPDVQAWDLSLMRAWGVYKRKPEPLKKRYSRY